MICSSPTTGHWRKRGWPAIGLTQLEDDYRLTCFGGLLMEIARPRCW